MKKANFLRISAFALALIFIMSTCVIAVSADNSSTSDSVSSTTTSDIQELLNAISYNDYISNKTGVDKATEEDEVTVSAVENWEYVLKNGNTPAEDDDQAKVTEEYGKTGLYIPSTGTVTWTTTAITKALKYNVVIEYYPVVNKAASIERVLLINGEVPFSEARQMSIEKVWATSEPYADVDINNGSVTLSVDGKDATKTVAEWIAEASANGIEAVETEKKVGGETKQVLRYTMPTVWNETNTAYVNKIGIRFFTTDIDENEIRSNLEDDPDWYEYTFKDSNGFMQEPFQVVFEPNEEGVTEITLRSVNEPIVISEIRLVAPEDTVTYEEYLAKYPNAPKGTGQLKMEAEYFANTSSQTIYPISDNTSAVTSPVAVDRTILNTVGGDKWQSAGQWIEYSFTVTSTGMYQIVPRFKQNLLDGMYTSRMLYIYSSDGEYDGLPFEEAGRLKFDYSSDWQAAPLTDGNTVFEFYFEEGVTYTLRFEISLGKMGDIVRRVQEALDSINDDYLNILKLTGSTPDEYRDYGFYRVMPDTMVDMIIQSDELEAISAELTAEAEVKSSMTATLDKVARLLDQMGKDEDEVAKNLEQLKTYIGSLGTWLSDAKTQPLVFDYICIQSSEAELPKAKANIFEALWHEIKGFVTSFFRNYDRMGAMTETAGEESVEVWLAYGRDQTQVIRGLINNDFTYHGGDPINLKLVSGGTLLPSILSQQGPDVYIGLGQGDVINYAIRGALVSIDDIPEHEEYKDNEAKFFEEFGMTPEEFYAEYEDSRSDFNEAAMMVLEIENEFGELHCYGLPETQNFSMMFVREDILAELNIEIPKTWDDVKKAIPVLQANNMQIGMHNDSKIFLYQNGGELFADDGMRINLDSNVALEAFTTMCDFFTMYSFPYSYDFANRFRTGEMPIGFATYTSTYNQLKVFATEIEGLWSFYPMPGVMDAEGNINNASVSSVSAIVMIVGCDNKSGAWDFMRWHVDDQCQIDYSKEMVAILGPSAKHATANESALKSLPWTADELEQLEYQFNNLASIPNYPGNYIVDRYLKFAFLDAYNDNLDPAKAIESYVSIINKEIARKREEFNLETLQYGDDVCPTLANKRLRQAEAELTKFKSSSAYSSSYDETYNIIMKLIASHETEDYASLNELADALEEQVKANGGATYTAAVEIAASNDKGGENNSNPYVSAVLAIEYMRDAANALKIYENYK
ncbi:MAG: extracellular solute-binding protein [Clostridia bacterium]|nr:extracellular solute-binding protein [Clostridia bacterium]